MLKNLIARFRQGHRTARYPAEEPSLPARFRGRPVVSDNQCPTDCRACAEVCPTEAITLAQDGTNLTLDLGRCLFCPDCTRECPEQAIEFSRDYRLATTERDDLLVTAESHPELAHALDRELRRTFGRSLKLRQVSAGGCNACEADINVLNTVGYDLSRFGIQLVASPRHADGLLITGPVTENMREALLRTWQAVPEPRIAIAVGACAIAGGPFVGHPEVNDGAGSIVPIDLYIPGCPPHPYTILDGMLRLLGRLSSGPVEQ